MVNTLSQRGTTFAVLARILILSCLATSLFGGSAYASPVRQCGGHINEAGGSGRGINVPRCGKDGRALVTRQPHTVDDGKARELSGIAEGDQIEAHVFDGSVVPLGPETEPDTPVSGEPTVEVDQEIISSAEMGISDSMTATTGGANSEYGYKSVAFFISWGVYAREYFAKDLPVEQLTHVMYAFADVDSSTGAIKLMDENADIKQKYETDKDEPGLNLYGSLKQLNLLKKRNRHLKLLLSVGGYEHSKHFVAPASKPEGRATFAKSCVDAVKNFGLDGIDVDWEYPEDDSQAQDYVLLLQETRKALDAYAKKLARSGSAPKFILTVSVPAGPDNYKKLRIAEMDKHLDFWNLMTYDYSGPWSDKVSHLANIEVSKIPGASVLDTRTAVKHYIRAGVKPRNIVLGMPLYGRAFLNTDGLGKSFKGVGKGRWGKEGEENGVWDYKDLPFQGSQEFVDKDAIAAYSYDPKRRIAVSYDNVQTIGMKGEYIKDKSLGGAMWWEASGDRKGEKSLIGTMARTLGQLEKSPNNLKYPDSIYANVRNGFQ